MSFDMHSFCRECGTHRTAMPFGSTDNFWDKSPCRKCGSSKYGKKLIAKWRLTKGWVDRDGNKITSAFLNSNERN